MRNSSNKDATMLHRKPEKLTIDTYKILKCNITRRESNLKTQPFFGLVNHEEVYILLRFMVEWRITNDY